MRFFSQSAFEYMRRQLDRYAGPGGKLLFMMPSLPPMVVLEIGNRLTSFCSERPNTVRPLIKVSIPLVNDWTSDDDPAIRDITSEVFRKGWRDDKENLTSYRNLVQEDGSLLVVLLIGVDRIPDMFRTGLHAASHQTCAAVVARAEGEEILV